VQWVVSAIITIPAHHGLYLMGMELAKGLLFVNNIFFTRAILFFRMQKLGTIG